MSELAFEIRAWSVIAVGVQWWGYADPLVKVCCVTKDSGCDANGSNPEMLRIRCDAACVGKGTLLRLCYSVRELRSRDPG